MNTSNNDDSLWLMIETIQTNAMRAMDISLQELPQHSAYKEAVLRAPLLVQRESNKLSFLRFEKFNASAAACRLASYWAQRKETFGDRAFLPMDFSGQGAMTPTDVKTLKTGYLLNLPCDDKNRSVLYYDRSKRPQDDMASPRVLFLAMQTAMGNAASQINGFVLIINVSNPYATVFNQSKLQFASNLLQHSMPLKLDRIHLICNCHYHPGVQDLLTAPGIACLRSYFNECTTLHLATSHSECLAKLSAYGLSRHGLPIASCGGTWSGDSCEPWRTGGGSCENYIQPLDPDLNCLVRNTLWTYNQSVSNDSIQEQCTPTATKTSSTATRTKSGRNKSTSPAAIHEEQEQDAKEKKRRMNVIYAQRKREKERIEKDVYDKQILELHGSNVSLQQENAHLEQLIQAAAKEISAQRQRYEEEEEKSETRTSQQQEQQHHARPARPTAGTADAEANAAPTAAASSPLSVDSQQQQQNQESCSQNIHQ